jgi:toxin FitB
VILLDTNVVSEPWKPHPSRAVLAWLDAQDELYLCTPVLAELRFGAERLPMGARKRRLVGHIDRLQAQAFRDRILTFDTAATFEFGRVGAQRELIGKRIEPIDAMIAAIVLAQGLKLATRDTNDFAGLGLELIDPFDAAVPG